MKASLFVILILTAFHSICKASVQLQLGFENNANDTSGNARNGTVVGTGPTFSGSSPAAIEGSYCVGSWSDSNYITVPGFVLPAGLGSSTSIDVDFFFAKSTSGALAVVYDFPSTSGHGNMRLAIQTAAPQFQFHLATSAGDTSVNATYAFQIGRWYRTRLTWSGTSWQLMLMDETAQVWTTVSSGTGGATIGATTWGTAYIGRYSGGTGFSWNGYIDSLTTTNTFLTSGGAGATYNPQFLVTTFGASITAGRLTGGSCNTGCGDGLRCNFQSLASTSSKNSYFVGANTCSANDQCTELAPFTDAVPGYKAIDVLNTISSALKANYITPTAQDYIVIGNDFCNNDGNAATNMTAFTSQVNALFVSATANTNQKVYLLLYPLGSIGSGAGVSYASTLTTVAASYPTVKTINAGSISYSSCDGSHPVVATYSALGQVLYSGLFSPSSNHPLSNMDMTKILFFGGL